MSIYKINKKTNFTTIDNNIFKNNNLSFKATGLLATMLSLPDNWDFSEVGLATLKKDNLKAIKSALKELEQEGYLVRNRVRDSKGRLKEIVYDVYEEPTCHFQTLENPTLEKDTQLNTNIIKDLNNKDKEIYKESWDCDAYVRNVADAEIGYLNELTGRNYRVDNPKSISLIRARLKEGFKVIDIMRVIETKVDEWLNTDMEKYLRPETLFGNKFENYVNQRRKK